MSRFTVGDIHGRYEALIEVLKASKFNYLEDKLILLGDICDGGYNTYEVVEELLKIKNLVFCLGNHDCLDAETEVLTKSGWKKYNELTLNDEVYSFDPQTEKGCWTKINEIISRDLQGQFKIAGIIKYDGFDVLASWDKKGSYLGTEEKHRFDLILVSQNANN